MRMTPHEVKTPVWTESDYGEPIATFGNPVKVPMFIGWTSSSQMDANNALYQQYEFVAITKALPEVGSMIDDKYIIGHVEKGRFNRLFMNYAEGVDREYVEQQSNQGEHS